MDTLIIFFNVIHNVIIILNYHHSLTCLSLSLIIIFILGNLIFNHPYINGCLHHPSIGLGSSSGAFNSLALIRRMPSESKVLAQFLMAGTGELRYLFIFVRLITIKRIFFEVYNLYPSCVSIFPLVDHRILHQNGHLDPFGWFYSMYADVNPLR